jgi:hypothetical protein
MRIFSLVFVLVFISMAAFTWAAPLPKEIVTVDPVSASAGEAIVISAFLYNDQKETITYTLEAKGGDTVIGKSVATLTKGSAKTVSFSWKQPKNKTTVSVNIVSALTTKKADLTNLHGSLGVLLVGAEESVVVSQENKKPVLSGKGFDGLKKTLEDFRIKQLTYFAKERDDSRAKIDQKDTVVPPSFENGDIEVAKVGNPTDYGMLILATSLASFFSSAWMFYGAIILILLLIVRFIFKSFI